MDYRRKEVIRNIIEKRIDELEQVLAVSSGKHDVLNEQLGDEATHCDTPGVSLSVDCELMTRAQSDLIRLHRQLQRIGQEEFGHCLLCAAEISANRIASVPATELCITCAQQQEKQQ